MIEHTRDTIGYLSRTEGMVANRTRFKILQAVAAIHILAVGGPFLWQAVRGMFKPPPPRIMNVRMITRLPDRVSEFSSSAPGGAPPPPSAGGAPAPPAVRAVRPQPVVPAPQQPKIRPVAFTPPPIAPAQPAVSPRPPPIRVASRTPTPPPKTVRQPQQAPKTQTAKQPDKDFRPMSQQDWQNMNRPPATANANTSSVAAPGGSRSSTGPEGPPGDGLPGDKFALDYSQFVAQYLKENWDTPSRIQLGGREPEVTIRIRFAPSGQIVAWEMLKPSGIAIMDTSVEKLMRFVKRIPQPPPKNLSELTLILAISD